MVPGGATSEEGRVPGWGFMKGKKVFQEEGNCNMH